jgi:hypothetical protein
VRHLPALACLLALACQPPGVGRPRRDDTQRDSEAPPDSGDGTAPTDTAGSEEVLEGEDPSSFLWGLDTVHRLEIALSEASWTALAATAPYSPGEYVPADIVFDGEAVGDVGLRLRGRWGSWRSLDGKAGFKIDLNRYVEGQTFHGLEKLTLNNMIVDCSFHREQLAWHVLERLGLPASRTGYVWVVVNGVDFGLYLNVESVDDRFLERVFGSPDGNLYEADYTIWPDGSYTLVDFTEAQQGLFTQQEGEDVGLADVQAVTEAIAEAAGEVSFADALGALVDVPAQQRLIAAEAWLGHIDGYSLNANNYFAFFPPGAGMQLLSWDLDYGFIDEAEWGFSWTRPTGVLSRSCLADAACAGGAHIQLTETLETVAGLDLHARLSEGIALTEPWIPKDPRQECREGWIRSYQVALDAWIDERAGHLEREWGL